MAKRPPNTGTHWTKPELTQLRTEAAQNTPTRVIALKHGRSPAAVYQKAADIGLSLKPTNQSPYNRRKN